MSSGVEKVGGIRGVRVPGPNGSQQQFQCASEAMARRVAASTGRSAPPPKRAER